MSSNLDENQLVSVPNSDSNKLSSVEADLGEEKIDDVAKDDPGSDASVESDKSWKPEVPKNPRKSRSRFPQSPTEPETLSVVTRSKDPSSSTKKYVNLEDLNSDDDAEKDSPEEVESDNDIPELVNLPPPDHVKIYIDELKEKVKCSTMTNQVRILTLVPKSWPVEKIANVFDVPIKLAQKAKEALLKYGIYPSIYREKEYTMYYDEISLAAFKFYDHEAISVGNNEMVWGSENGKRRQKEKRLLLYNLKENHSIFLLNNPTFHVSFSRFTMLKPYWCKVIVAPKPNSFCYNHSCLKHMMEFLPKTGKCDLDHIMSLTICEEPTRECHTNKCDKCPERSVLQFYLESLFEDNLIDELDELSVPQWSEGKLEPTNTIWEVWEFIEHFVSLVYELRLHHYLAKQQSQYYEDAIRELDNETAIVHMDFSENFAFVTQSTRMGVHRCQERATISPYCIYYKENEDTLTTLKFCFISDCLSHNPSTVYAFNHEIVTMLKSRNPRITKILYFSHGSTVEYKNSQTFQNLCNHEQEFGLKAEWHFFPMNHGKEPCNAISANLKFAVILARILKRQSHILTAKELYNWARTSIKSMEVLYMTRGRVDYLTSRIQKRLRNSNVLMGTLSFFAFIPVDNINLQCALTSRGSEWQEKSLADKPVVSHTVHKSGNFVVCTFDSCWWLGIVDKVAKHDTDYKVNFMHPHGPAEHFYWPKERDECYIPVDNVLCSGISLIALPDRKYRLEEKDMIVISECFFVKREPIDE